MFILAGYYEIDLAMHSYHDAYNSFPAQAIYSKEKDKLPALGGLFSNGFHILMCDGAVRMMPHTTTAKLLRPMITPQGND